LHWASLDVELDDEKYTLDLPGLYQVKNLQTVLTTVAKLRDLGYDLPLPNVKQALSQVKKMNGLHGRWDLLQTQPTIIADVAHNADGMQQVLAQLKALKENGLTYAHLHIVIGMVSDKDVTKVLSLLPKEATYYFCNADIPRALPAKELQDKANAFDLQGNGYTTVKAALEAAKQQASPNDLILICGSVFVVGEVYG
jgi:dihydrofolate synthase / folylpolyglutamate synthase